MSVLPRLYGLFYTGDVGDKLLTAHELFRLYGRELASEADIAALLPVLERRQKGVVRQMGAMEMGSLCTACAKGADGGCCSMSFAAETDVVQLLLNLLAGVEIVRVEDSGADCCYLGERGCLFPYKPMFCLNYLCMNITFSSSGEELGRLEAQTAKLFAVQQLLEEKLINFFRRKLEKNRNLPGLDRLHLSD